MYNISELEDWVAKNNLPKYRAKQIYQAITKNLISNWNESIELPKDWYEVLNKELPISSLVVEKKLESSTRDSIKIVLKTKDELILESVLMKHNGNRNTVCASTQIGCAVACNFCATGQMGFKRDLEAEEIVDQVLEFARILKQQDEKVTNVVFMGMGEPFLNYENVIKAIKILNDKDGFNLGHRHMTVSTSGIVPGILRFADEAIQVNLAISLHAPNDEIRSSIMPINKKYPLKKLLPAVSKYMEKTGRKVFFEYILFKGINESLESTKELVNLMKSYFPEQMQLVHINLIAYNPTETIGAPLGLSIDRFESPSRETIKQISDTLQKNSILTTIRYHFGGEINAACGQLAGK
jgi:23S rRNA (adenine2503-C2)-methyltransferase